MQERCCSEFMADRRRIAGMGGLAMLNAGCWPCVCFLSLFFPFLLCVIRTFLLHLQHGVPVSTAICYGCQDACITELAEGGHILL